MTDFSPREIVSELDRFIVGQPTPSAPSPSPCATAGAAALAEALRDEVTPKNILMIGPTGVGKTEIARRLAKLAGAPFLKVEATKFTEVGYVGRDVDQIVRDLVEIAHRADARAAAQGVKAQGRGGGRGAGPRRAGRRRRRPDHPRSLPQEAARRRARRQGGRARARRPPARHADVRHSRPARRVDGRAQSSAR